MHGPLLVVLFSLLGPEPTAGQSELTGTFGVETRMFAGEPLWIGQPRWLSMSAVAEIEWGGTLGESVFFRTIGRGRGDQSDTDRSYVELREALVQWGGADVAVSLGVNTVFWGVTESRHLVDIVNQTDYRADLAGSEKLGQLMTMATVFIGPLGALDLFVMTGSRAQRYPGPGGRPGVPLPVNYESAEYEAPREAWNIDVAARWELGTGRWDGALSYFRGTAREPQLVPAGTALSPALRPRYDLTEQVGIELQWTAGSWLWKAEGIARSGQGPTFTAATVGFEHTRFALLGGAADLGTILEYSYDGRENLTYNIYDSDVFGGVRLSLNDADGTEVLAGVLRDIGAAVTIASAEASRRLGERWRLEVVGRYFKVTSTEDPTYWFRRDDHVQVLVEYYF